MSPRVLGCLIVGLLAGSSGCSPSPSSTAEGSPPLSEYRFDLDFPADWTRPPGPPGVALAVSPRTSEGDFPESVSALQEFLPRRMSLAEYSEMNLESMQKELKEFRVVEEGTGRLGDLDSHWVVYRYGTPPKELQAIVFFAVHEKDGFLVTGTAVPESFPAYLERFREIAGSLRVQPRGS